MTELDQLRAAVARLEAETARLSRFVERVFDLTLVVADAPTVCRTIQSLAREARGVRMCDVNCSASHPPARWAEMLGVHRVTVYDWMKKYELGNGDRTITHRDMRDFLRHHPL